MITTAVDKLKEQRDRESYIRLLEDLKQEKNPSYEHARNAFKTKYGYDYLYIGKTK